MGVTLVIYSFSESGAYICSGTYLISACVSAGSGRSVSNTANISESTYYLGLFVKCTRLYLSFMVVRRVGNQAHYKALLPGASAWARNARDAAIKEVFILFDINLITKESNDFNL